MFLVSRVVVVAGLFRCHGAGRGRIFRVPSTLSAVPPIQSGGARKPGRAVRAFPGSDRGHQRIDAASIPPGGVSLVRTGAYGPPAPRTQLRSDETVFVR